MIALTSAGQVLHLIKSLHPFIVVSCDEHQLQKYAHRHLALLGLVAAISMSQLSNKLSFCLVDKKCALTVTLWLKPAGNRGMMAFSISMAVSASRSFGPPSDLVLPPGILPTPDRGSLYSICTKQQGCQQESLIGKPDGCSRAGGFLREVSAAVPLQQCCQKRKELCPADRGR